MKQHWIAVVALLLAGTACAPGAPPANAEPQAIAADSLARAQLVDIRTIDSTLRVDVRYATPNNFTGAPLPGYGPQRVLLRREAAVALARVQQNLRGQGLGLLVFDGYRPVRATLAMVEWAERTGRTQLLDDGYIARRSRHNQGVAIDLTLVHDSTGVPLEMGTPYDTFDSAAHTANATGRIAQNRALLVNAMEAEGFVNYDQEWWHFSFPVSVAVPYDVKTSDQ